MNIPLPQRFSRTSRALHIEHLVLQRDHLLLVRDRHLQWMAEAEQPQIREAYHEIAGMLQEAAAEYGSLLTMLQEQKALKEDASPPTPGPTAV